MPRAELRSWRALVRFWSMRRAWRNDHAVGRRSSRSSLPRRRWLRLRSARGRRWSGRSVGVVGDERVLALAGCGVESARLGQGGRRFGVVPSSDLGQHARRDAAVFRLRGRRERDSSGARRGRCRLERDRSRRRADRWPPKAPAACVVVSLSLGLDGRCESCRRSRCQSAARRHDHGRWSPKSTDDRIQCARTSPPAETQSKEDAARKSVLDGRRVRRAAEIAGANSSAGSAALEQLLVEIEVVPRRRGPTNGHVACLLA